MSWKKLLVFLCVVLSASTCLAAGSWTTSTKDVVSTTSDIRTVQLTFTADAADHTTPVYTFTAGDKGFTEGYYLYAVKTVPGATGPTNGAWDVTIKDANAYEILGNAADNRSSTLPQVVLPKYDGSSTSYPPFTGGATTITIEDNLVNSATATIILFFVK